MAMVAALGGNPRSTEIMLIVAALAACSGVSRSEALPEVNSHVGVRNSSTSQRAPTAPAKTAAAVTAARVIQPRRRGRRASAAGSIWPAGVMGPSVVRPRLGSGHGHRDPAGPHPGRRDPDGGLV